jgi:hypothetical protein
MTPYQLQWLFIVSDMLCMLYGTQANQFLYDKDLTAKFWVRDETDYRT